MTRMVDASHRREGAARLSSGQTDSSSVLLGTLVSVITLTTVMWLVKNDLVPQSLFR
jgi:hypothetical protein